MSVTVGFSPVTPGSSSVSGGVSTAAGAEGDSALGFVDALLGMLTQSLGVGPQTGGETGAGTPSPEQAPNLADIGLAVDAAIRNDLPADLPEGSDKLLDDLVAALAAIDDAAESGQSVDPALHKKLTETLDEIAGMLGITLPVPPAIDPTITAVAGAVVTTPDITLDAGLTMESKPLPPGYELPVADEAQGKPDTKLADDFLKAVAAVTTPVIEEEKKVEDKQANGATPADEAESAEPETTIGKLVARLTEIAEKLEGRLPDISAKLEALAQRLSSNTLDPEILAKLEASLDAGDFDLLLAPRPEARKPAAPAPSLFTAPTLPTPAVAALPPKQTADAPRATEPIAPSEPKLAAPVDKPVAKDTKPVERTDADPKVRDRGSFAAQLADARAEKLADQAQQGQPAAAATAVRTDMGVVTPKAVHAAYQAPVQQINVPQVAFEVVRQFNQGASRFQIRLDPPELGRIDVRMQVDGDGNVHARMTVERSETLDLMQRDQRSLEKALAQAGLDSGKTSLEFSLRQNPFARDGQSQQQGGHNPFLRDTASGADEAPDIATTTTQYRGMASASGVNLFV